MTNMDLTYHAVHGPVPNEEYERQHPNEPFTDRLVRRDTEEIQYNIPKLFIDEGEE